MSKESVMKQLKKFKEVAEKSDNAADRDIWLAFHDVFKYLVDRVSPINMEISEYD